MEAVRRGWRAGAGAGIRRPARCSRPQVAGLLPRAGRPAVRAVRRPPPRGPAMRAGHAAGDFRPGSGGPRSRSPRPREPGSARLRPIVLRAPHQEPMRNPGPMPGHFPRSCVLPGRSVVIKCLVGPSQQVCRHRSPGLTECGPGTNDFPGGARCAVRPGAEPESKPLRGPLAEPTTIPAYCPQPHGVGAGRGFDSKTTSTTSNTSTRWTMRKLRGCEGGTDSTGGGLDGGDDNACRRSRQIHRSRWTRAISARASRAGTGTNRVRAR